MHYNAIVKARFNGFLKLDYFEEQKKNITTMIEITGRKIEAFNKKQK